MATKYASIRVEGGFLAGDVLASIADGTASGQAPRDFGFTDKTSLLDQISAAWSDARSYWPGFERRVAQLKDGETGTTFTRNQWVVPLLGVLGFEHITLQEKAAEVDGVSYAISHRAGTQPDSPPIHIVGAGQSLNERPSSGRPRLAPHSLVQEYLNRTEHLWGMATNGFTLRLMRDSQLIRRQAYLEVDLRTMFAGEGRFADFALLYRLIHRSRFPQRDVDGKSCLLERWFQHTVEQGGRIREKLREGVENAIPLIANGILRHPANTAIIEAVRSGDLKAKGLYQELLRLIYRLLFLMVTEERNILTKNPVYRDRYSVSRLRRLCETRQARNSHTDLWTGLHSTFRLFHTEDLGRVLQVPPLNGELFDLNRTETLNAAVVANRDLLDALWHLSLCREDDASPPRHVNYAALDVEELGSVYESLLELQPTFDESTHPVAFILVPGLERKGTGSFYTPPELVEELLKSAVLPVLASRLQGARSTQEKEAQLLRTTVCDPACGSGHFLLAAARRLGRELAKLRSGEDEPTPSQYSLALRDVIAHCIYGVDRNPLAVELCKVALWLESYTEAKPLSFLDHRIQLGDSLVGLRDLSTLAEGIPEEAYKPVTGDDKSVAKDAKAANKRSLRLKGQMRMFTPDIDLTDFQRARSELDAIPDDSPAQVNQKRRLLDQFRSSAKYGKDRQAANLWTLAFFARLTDDNAAHGIPLTDHLREALDGRNPDPQLVAEAAASAQDHSFFHWPLEFPEVFARGGFDVLLSNPPWEMLQLEEQQFFASRSLTIARAPNAAARKSMISALPKTNPALWQEYQAAMHDMDCLRKYIRASELYPLTSSGRNNTYSLFAERLTTLVSPQGRIGAVVPTGIATDDTNKNYFASIATSGRLLSLFDFENREGIFPEVHRSYKFCLLTIAGKAADNAPPAQFAFFLTQAEQLADRDRIFPLTPDEFSLLNPNTKTCPIFRTRRDAELTKAIYKRVPILWQEAPDVNPWELQFKQGLFNMASDSHNFRTAAELEAEGYRRDGNTFVSAFNRYLPLYEAKMLHQFDHRWCTYTNAEDTADLTQSEKESVGFTVQPRYWIREELVKSAAPHYPEDLHTAQTLGDRDAVGHILMLWAAGDALNSEQPGEARKFLQRAQEYRSGAEEAMPATKDRSEDWAMSMARRFPLSPRDRERLQGPNPDLSAIASEVIQRFSPRWLVAYRAIARSTDERSAIFSALPLVGVGHSAFLACRPTTDVSALLGFVANANTFVLDYVLRQKLGGINFNYFILKQLPVLGPAVYNTPQAWQQPTQTFGMWILPRVLELVYSASDLNLFAEDCGYRGAPFRWDETRRATIRAELDAAFLHAYGIGRQDAAYILSAKVFPIVAANAPETFPRILAIYDAMAEAMRAGTVFESRLSPAPGQEVEA